MRALCSSRTMRPTIVAMGSLREIRPACTRHCVSARGKRACRYGRRRIPRTSRVRVLYRRQCTPSSFGLYTFISAGSDAANQVSPQRSGIIRPYDYLPQKGPIDTTWFRRTCSPGIPGRYTNAIGGRGGTCASH